MTAAVKSGRVDEVTYRVLAPNASLMTLSGTNTYLLGAPDEGSVVVVDPGPNLVEHRRQVDDAVQALGVEIAGVVITHHHADHAEAAPWSHDWDVPLYAFSSTLVPDSLPLLDGQYLDLAGLRLRALHTPGHASDHLCLLVEQTGVALSGDHVLGGGTSVVFWPDGDLAAYLHSLHRLADVHATRLDPGHGPPVSYPAQTIASYIAHRSERDDQIIEALKHGASTPAAIVAVVYADVDPALHPAAERSVRAHLVKMEDSGVLRIIDPLDAPEPALELRNG